MVNRVARLLQSLVPLWMAMAAPSAPALRAAELDGVTLPDRHVLDGTELRLNGLGQRTFSWLGIRIYVAGLYLEHPTHDAEAILRSPEKKLIEVQFIHDVDVERARDAWRDGFERNCLPPCRLATRDIDRFLASVPAMRAGDHSTLAFSPGTLNITMNGKRLGTIRDETFAWAVLATFIGPDPPTDRLKAGLLGLAR